MKPTVVVLIAEPNWYFAHGFMQALSEHFRSLGVEPQFTQTVADKVHADIVFVAAEKEGVQLRYLTQRHSAPLHQHIFIFKEKPGQMDKIIYKDLDGIFYRYQSLHWAMQVATQGLQNLYLAVERKPSRISRRVPLTEREKEILHYLAMGLRSCDIGRTLRISQKTVSGHKRNAMAKLGLNRPSDLNYWLLRGGITHLPCREQRDDQATAWPSSHAVQVTVPYDSSCRPFGTF